MKIYREALVTRPAHAISETAKESTVGNVGLARKLLCLVYLLALSLYAIGDNVLASDQVGKTPQQFFVFSCLMLGQSGDA